MSQTKEGARKAAESIKARYGDDWYENIGRKGGAKRVRKGFAAMPKEKVRAAGMKGGAISRPYSRKKKEEKKRHWPWSK